MWRAENLIAIYRSSNAIHKRVYDHYSESKWIYSIYLDSSGTDHYQKSDRNPRREIRRRGDGKWEFKTSKGVWELFEKPINSTIEKSYQSMSVKSHSGEKRKHQSSGHSGGKRKQSSGNADMSMSLVGVDARVDDYESKFLSLMQRIRAKPNQFAMIYTDQKNSLNFNAKFKAFSRPRGTSLRKDQTNSWKFIPNISDERIKLLIPPIKYDSTDISDFAKKYGKTAWKELFHQMRTYLSTGNYWVYTHGEGEDILHIRFEPLSHYPQRKYLI